MSKNKLERVKITRKKTPLDVDIEMARKLNQLIDVYNDNGLDGVKKVARAVYRNGDIITANEDGTNKLFMLFYVNSYNINDDKPRVFIGENHDHLDIGQNGNIATFGYIKSDNMYLFSTIYDDILMENKSTFITCDDPIILIEIMTDEMIREVLVPEMKGDKGEKGDKGDKGEDGINASPYQLVEVELTIITDDEIDIDGGLVDGKLYVLCYYDDNTPIGWSQVFTPNMTLPTRSNTFLIDPSNSNSGTFVINANDIRGDNIASLLIDKWIRLYKVV